MKTGQTILGLLAVALTLPVGAVELPGPVVDTAWLAKHQQQVLILDVREDLKSFNAKPIFSKDKKSGKIKLVKVAGHIPGAVLVNYKQLRADRMEGGQKVQKMIVGKAAFEKVMQASGANNDSRIVIVSQGEGDLDMTMATRFYWQLKYYGHDRMAILDGGMGQWLTDKRPISVSASKVTPGSWKATAERKEIFASSDEVAAAAKQGIQLVDTRPLSLYLGTWYKKSYVYAAGHIPGAKSFPNELLTQHGTPATFHNKDEYQQLMQGLGIKTDQPAMTYCNSGHLASGSWFVLSEILGNKNVKLYDGSMHQWTQEKRPVVKFKME